MSNAESMAEAARPSSEAARPSSERFAFGGLEFDVAFRGTVGATLRVDGTVDGELKELLRFDDFVGVPHYHAPADAEQINFDRANGDPLEWYIAQIRDHLADWLTSSGFGDVVPTIDVAKISANAGTLRAAMEDCVPAGFVRVPGVGLQQVD